MLLVRQSKNTFIRCTDNYGYIIDQLKRQDRVYDRTGSIFLRQISRKPVPVADCVNNIKSLFPEIDYETLHEDFMEFVDELCSTNFLVKGESVEELDNNDLSFTYAIDNPKTLNDNFEQTTLTNVSENTQDFFLEEVQGRPLISSIQFELSSRCNERCIHCYIPNKKKDEGADMPLIKVLSIIDEFAAMGGLHVTLSGGEAFLHRDLIEICKYCRAKDLKISILSNLIAITDNQINQLKDLNLSLIQTSLYSMDAHIHDKITSIPGSFLRTKNAIERLVKADIPVQISCPLMKANYKGYKDVIAYAKSLKIKAQTDYIMMAQADLDDSNLANRLSLEQTEAVLREIIENDVAYNSIVLNQKSISNEVISDPQRFMTQPVCGVGYDNCCITVNGDVYPCAGWQGYVLGNVYTNSLKEIWENSPKVKELRKITQASFPLCLDCEALDYCNRCLVRNFNESEGDMFAIPKHFCDVAFLNKKLVEEYEMKIASNTYKS